MTEHSPPAPPAAPALRPLEPADLCQLASVGAVAVHPAGDGVVYTVTWPDSNDDRNRSELWLHRDGVAPTVLVRGQANTGPRFSPSGVRLALVRRHEGGATVVVLDWADRRLTDAARFRDGVGQLRWIDDDRLAVVAPTRPADQDGVGDGELARRPRRLDRLDYRFNGRGWIVDRRRAVHVIDLAAPNGADGRGDQPSPALVTRLPVIAPELDDDADRAEHLAVAASPDGSALAVAVTGMGDDDLTGASRVWRVPLDGGPATALTPPGGIWTDVVWLPDGSVVAVGRPDASVHGFARPHRCHPDGGRPEVLGPVDVNSLPTIGPSAAAVAVDGAVLTAGSRRGGLTVERFELSGAHETVVQGRFQVTAFDASPDGTTVVGAVTSIHRPAELWHLAPGPARPLVALNDDLLARLDLAPVEEVEIPTVDGRSIQGWITRPPGSAPSPTAVDGSRPAPDGSGPGRPGLVYVHGGPMSQYGWGFFDEFQLAAAAGFVVIGANPTGSDGYGEDWATAIVGDLGGRDWADVRAVTDHLAALPGVDGDRIGIGGGSYGGFMSAWAIGHTDRYRAALVERSVTNWTTMAGTSDIGAYFLPAVLGASPDGDPEALIRQSPITHAASVTTPTLILHSEQDWRCPPEQAEQFFAALRRNGCEVALVRFPAENHELSRSGAPRHRVERFDLIHDFFRHHLC